MKIVFDHKKYEAENIVTFYFVPERKIKYSPGQYIELTLQHEDVDEFGNIRTFSISSSPSEKYLTVTSKIVESDPSSFKRSLVNISPGTKLEISEPQGSFTLPKSKKTPIILVAGGIGITPFRSMIKWLHDNNDRRDIRLIYGVTYENEIIFNDIQELVKEFKIVVGKPSKNWNGLQGYLTPEMILSFSEDIEPAQIYLSGPEQMIKILTESLVGKGVSERQIILDHNNGYRLSK